MKNIVAILLWWILELKKQFESWCSSIKKEPQPMINKFVLPIYKNPFIAGSIKPPTA